MSALAKPDGFARLLEFTMELVAKETGNVLGAKQAHMVQSRLSKRMIDLKIQGPDQYLDYVKLHLEQEKEYLISILTTHHTFFFREFVHFEFLQKNLIHLVNNIKNNKQNKIRILCLACSKGQEVYSLAMFFNYHLAKLGDNIDFEIFGSDVDRESVKFAEKGVYRYNEIKSIPSMYLDGNWQRGKGDLSEYVRVKKDLKDKVKFGHGNLLNVSQEHKNKKYDVIFCRNVFIYFENHQIKDISTQIFQMVEPHGYFFTGISESLSQFKFEKITSLAPSVYAHVIEQPKVEEQVKAPVVEMVKTPEVVIPDKLKVLCVDDSRTVLTVLKKIFSSRDDFEVVGTAANGLEAQEFLKNNQVDVMTLDIHMPQMNGIEYLQKNYKKGHPSVVIVSSANREDTDVASKAFTFGACDFVEKPALNNIDEKADEICTKLKVAYLDNLHANHVGTSIDKSFAHKLKITEETTKAYVFYINLSNIKKFTSAIRELYLYQGKPAVVVLTEGNHNVLPAVISDLNQKITEEVSELADKNIKPGHIYFCDLNQQEDLIHSSLEDKTTSLMIVGQTSQSSEMHLIGLDSDYVLVEDLGEHTSSIKDVASDIVPLTSFAYMAHSFFSKKDEK